MCSEELLVDYLTLTVSGISTVCIIAKYNLFYCSYFVGAFCIFDLYYILKIKKIDIIIHHLLVITLIYFLFSSNVDDSEKLPIVETILSTEFSTNFLILKSILPRIRLLPSGVVHINNLLFVATFFYYRVYNYFVKILISKNLFFIIVNNFTGMRLFLLFFSIYGFFALNIYWSWLILKKCYSLKSRKAVTQ
jgi:hypothetical protein